MGGYVATYRSSYPYTGASVFMGMGFQTEPNINWADAIHHAVKDREIKISATLRRRQRVICQADSFPSFYLDNLAIGDRIPYFWKDWREVRGRQDFWWTLSNLTHNSSHTVYCLTDDGISSTPLTLET